MGEKYKLTYFNIKAVGEPIRLLFAYAGVPYEDNRIEQANWPPLKATYFWGHLPILQFGDKTLAQSNAICRYLGKKFKLNGSNEWEDAKIDEMADSIADFRGEWGKIVRAQDPAVKAELQKTFATTTVPAFLGKWEARLAKSSGDSPYLVGKNLTWVDIMMAHYLDLLQSVGSPEVLDHFPNLGRLKKKVFEIPQIKAWVDKRPATPM